MTNGAAEPGPVPPAASPGRATPRGEEDDGHDGRAGVANLPQRASADDRRKHGWHLDGGDLFSLCLALALFATIASDLHTRALDIAVYRQAAERVFISGTDPYTRRAGDVLPFTYPPTALFLIYPFSRLDLSASERLVWGLNLLLVPLLMLTLVFHQINLLILLCLWLFWRGLRRGQSGYGAGAALALGSVAKPHYAVLLLGTLPRPAPRLLLGAAVVALALVILSLRLAPAGSWGAWLTQIVEATSYSALPPGHSSIAAPWNRSIAGLVARFLVPNKFTEPMFASPEAARLLSAALVLAITAVSAWALVASMRKRRRDPAGADPTRIDLELSVLSVWIFLAAPASWTHHLVMLLPAALVLLRDAVLDPNEARGSRLTAALVLAVLALTLDDLVPRELRIASQAIMSLMTLGVLSLWLLLVERLHRLA